MADEPKVEPDAPVTQTDGVGPPEAILAESVDISDVLNPDGTVKTR